MDKSLFQWKQEILTNGSLVLIANIHGDIGSTVRYFEEKLTELFHQAAENIIIVFSGTWYISTEIGVLIKFMDKFQEQGGNVKLANVPKEMMVFFDSLDLLSIFEIYKTEEDALNSLSLTDDRTPLPPSPPPLKSAPIPFPNKKNDQ